MHSTVAHLQPALQLPPALQRTRWAPGSLLHSAGLLCVLHLKHHLAEAEFESRAIQFVLPSGQVHQVPKSSAAELGPTEFLEHYVREL